MNPISDSLAGKNNVEKADIKSDAVAADSPLGVHSGEVYGHTIEILQINKIERGIEVLARAWDKNGDAIGFGDGTVEIERFRIFNPPIIVADPNGDIVTTYESDVTGKTYEYRYREDARAALLQTLDHNIFAIPTFGNKNIVQGKIGNTTDTFFPSAGAVSPCDGRANRDGDEIFSTIRTGAGTTARVATALEEGYMLNSNATSNHYDQMRRQFYLFDTSTIGTDTISSATLSLFGDSSVGKTNGLGETTMDIVATSPAANDNLVAADYSNMTYGTSFGSIAYASFSTSAYNDFTLSAAGIANINKTGISKFGSTSGWDVSGTGPTWVSGSQTFITVFMADQAGTTNDPKLVVVHAAGGAVATPIPTLLFLGAG